MLSDAELIELAGKAAFGRGRGYHADGRVRLAETSADAVAGKAEGNRTYSFWLKRDGGQWRWSCACPAADDGAFCKHLVAAVLTVRDGDAEAGETKSIRDDLLQFLCAQPVERLAGWLKALADDDADVDKRLRLFRAAQEPAALKAAVSKVLSPGGFLDYRASLRYAERLGALLDALRARLADDPAHCRELCEYALGRLFKIYERCDDSAGAIGERMYEVAELHAHACAAAPSGNALAKTLITMQRNDSWDMLTLADYWNALGDEGRLAYGRLIADELEKLPPRPNTNNRHGDAVGIRARAEAYARTSGDFELLQRVLRWDLEHAYNYLRVLESLREFGREREALAWAEDAVKRFPHDNRLREALSDCLQAAGLGEEALEQCWQAFRLRPGEDAWDALKHMAADAWPPWRARALAEIAARERGDASLRVRLLMHDGDLDTAVMLARAHHVWVDTLHGLAQRLERNQPTVAGEFYLRLSQEQLLQPQINSSSYPKLVANLKRASRLLPTVVWQPAVTALRQTYSRKTKLMTLLGEADL
jgi:tetratricopeptide (TPR) repeat protein